MKLEKSTKHPVFGAIRRFRKYAKLYGTYTKMEVAEDGRVYTAFDPTGTATWRLSSYESHLGVGTDLQNLPKRSEEGREIRKFFIPDEGFELVAWDLAQAEDRIVTYKAGDEIGIEAYEAGIDPHWENAKSLFRLPREESYNKNNPEHYRMRNKISKHVKHAGNYGVGPIQLRDMLITMADYWEYDVSDCKDILEAQKIARPRIEQWKHWVRQQIRMNRTLTSCINRKRIFLGRINDDLFRKAYAFDPQNTIGELTSMNLRDVFSDVCDENFAILMNVHDEGVAQVRKGMRNEYLKKVKKACHRTIQIEDIFGIRREIVIPTEFSVGENFGELEEVEI
jgi:DNA polymerase-1